MDSSPGKPPIYRIIVAIAVLSVGVAIGSDIVWSSSSGGNWGVAGNWSPNQVPGAGDNVFITNSGTYTVTMNVGASIGSLILGGASGTQTLLLSGFPLNLAMPSMVNSKGILS